MSMTEIKSDGERCSFLISVDSRSRLVLELVNIVLSFEIKP